VLKLLRQSIFLNILFKINGLIGDFLQEVARWPTRMDAK